MATNDCTQSENPDRQEPTEPTQATGADTAGRERADVEDLGFGQPYDQPPVPADTSRSQPAASDDEKRPSADGRSMAVISHMSVLFGIPVFLVPVLRRRTPLGVHHAKAASLIYFGFYLNLALAMFASGFFLPVAMLFYLPGVVGVYRALRRQEAGKWGLGDLAERLFPHPTSRND